MIKFAAVLMCLFSTTAYAQAEFFTAPEWGEIKSSGDNWHVWGRKFENNDGSFFPTQIFSQKIPIFAAPPSIILSTDSSSHLPLLTPSQASYRKTDILLASTKKTQQGNLAIELNTQLEYDGFMRFDLTLIPNKPVKVYELAINLPIRRDIAKKFSRYIEYNYNTQRVNMGDLKNSAGHLSEPVHFSFNPAVWIGNDSVGIEWITETNLEWQLDKPARAISISPDDELTNLKVRFIDAPKGYNLKNNLTLSFALFITPSRPADNNAYQMTSGIPTYKNSGKCPTILQFFNWSQLPVQYPGIPDVQSGFEPDYHHLVKSTNESGRKFIPYSSLYILPSTQPDIMKNKDIWSAAAARHNSHWETKLQTSKPILPITMDSKSIQNFLISKHSLHKKIFNTNGVYFDGAAPYENAAFKTFGQLLNNNGHHLQYVPMFSHRSFLKSFWEEMKSIDSSFLILHHAPRVPKFATAFTDIVVVGEELHRIFKTENLHLINKGVHPNGLPKLAFDRPEYYIPNYKTLPASINIGMRHHKDGVKYMLLPQVKKFNDDYLRTNPDLFSKWSQSALDFAKKNDMLLWFARLKNDLATESNNHCP